MPRAVIVVPVVSPPMAKMPVRSVPVTVTRIESLAAGFFSAAAAITVEAFVVAIEAWSINGDQSFFRSMSIPAQLFQAWSFQANLYFVLDVCSPIPRMRTPAVWLVPTT